MNSIKTKFYLVIFCIFILFQTIIVAQTPTPSVTPTPIPQTYYVSKSGNDSNDGVSWNTALLNIKTALGKTISGDSVRVAVGTYIEGETIEVKSGVSVYGGFQGTETTIDERGTSTSKTIIDGNKSYGCVTNYGTIDSLYIQNGKMSSGGGAGVDNNHGKIINCVITGNSSTYSGGVSNTDGTILNCSIVGNSATFSGGLLNNTGTITNCIIWKNYPSDLAVKTGTVSYSCFPESDGTNNNIKGNPKFADTSSSDTLSWDLHLSQDSPCIDAGNSSASETPSEDIDGNPRPGGNGKVCMGAYESPDNFTQGIPAPAVILYVSKSGDNSSGENWAHAFSTIDDAIEHADKGNDLFEIRVAEGTYIEGKKTIVNSRTKLMGGWSGNQSFPDECDFITYKTIIDGNKSYQSVFNCGSIEALYIQNGYSSDLPGGGVYNYSGYVLNCTITENSTSSSNSFGGGVYNLYGTITHSTITNNSSMSSMGGVSNFYGRISNCTISENSASVIAGGVYNDHGLITNCTISRNSAVSSAGGANNWYGTITNCIITGNSAANGSGIKNTYGTIMNCIVTKNSSSSEQGGVYNDGLLTNCTIIGNSSSLSGGVYNISSGTINNCIVWDNIPTDISIDSGVLSYSCFSEADGTNNNINTNPLFVDVSDTDSLTWDLHLSPDSPCIDKGTTTTVTSDFDRVPRPVGAGWDMGAYEYYLPGDINSDRHVDIIDVQSISDYLCKRIFFTDAQKFIADYNIDGKNNIADIAALLNFLNTKKEKRSEGIFPNTRNK